MEDVDEQLKSISNRISKEASRVQNQHNSLASCLSVFESKKELIQLLLRAKRNVSATLKNFDDIVSYTSVTEDIRNKIKSMENFFSQDFFASKETKEYDVILLEASKLLESLNGARRLLAKESSRKFLGEKMIKSNSLEKYFDLVKSLLCKEYVKLLQEYLPGKSSILRTFSGKVETSSTLFLKNRVLKITKSLLIVDAGASFIKEYVRARMKVNELCLLEVSKVTFRRSSKAELQQDQKLLETFLRFFLQLLKLEKQFCERFELTGNLAYSKAALQKLFLGNLSIYKKMIGKNVDEFFKGKTGFNNFGKLVNYVNANKFLEVENHEFDNLINYGSKFMTMEEIPRNYEPMDLAAPRKKFGEMKKQIRGVALKQLDSFFRFMEERQLQEKSHSFINGTAGVEAFTIKYINLVSEMIKPTHIEGFERLLIKDKENAKYSYSSFDEVVKKLLDSLQKKLEAFAKNTISKTNVSEPLVWLFLVNNYHYVYDTIAKDVNFATHLSKQELEHRGELLNHTKIIYLEAVTQSFLKELKSIVQKRSREENIDEHVLFVNRWIEEIEASHKHAVVAKKPLQLELQLRIKEKVLIPYADVFNKPDLVGFFKVKPEELDKILSHIFQLGL
eukprot:maker-scaffold_8-snap-gene-14.11-mRNA-1 protein AED:0.01 eAED:0.01 QI:17/1/1/1/1/1/2/1290/619